jgi:hypothetical protein
VKRILTSGGKFICLTLGESHVLGTALPALLKQKNHYSFANAFFHILNLFKGIVISSYLSLGKYGL